MIEEAEDVGNSMKVHLKEVPNVDFAEVVRSFVWWGQVIPELLGDHGLTCDGRQEFWMALPGV